MRNRDYLKNLTVYWILQLIKALSLIILCMSAAHATDKGLFWKLEAPNGNVSYLFGTIHTDDNRVTNFSPAVLNAIKASDVFVMETEPNANPRLYQMQGTSLRNMLTERELEQVKALADYHVMPVETVMHMKPWLLAAVFDLPKPQTPFAQDNLLMSEAENNGKTVAGIETNQEHFSVIDSLSYEEQLVVLRTVLKRSQRQKEKDFERLIALYLAGNSDKIKAFDEKTTAAMLPKSLWEKMRNKLLDKRNTLITDRTIKMANEKTLFIAVGASHLAGENGLINRYKKAGFLVTVLNM